MHLRRICARCTQLLFVVFSISQTRLVESRSHSHSKRSTKGHECANDANEEMHRAFSKMVNRRDEQMFSYFQPDNQMLMEFQPADKRVLSATSRDCAAQDRSMEVLPGQPLIERSVCPYHHVLNYNPNRLPAAITEVECTCESVHTSSGVFHCEPMYYNMRVLLFQENCGKFVETVQRVSLACVPVFSNQINAGGTITYFKPTTPTVPV